MKIKQGQGEDTLKYGNDMAVGKLSYISLPKQKTPCGDAQEVFQLYTLHSTFHHAGAAA